MGNISAVIIILGFLIFVGWVFTVTDSAWAFALLLLMPEVNVVTKSDKTINSKKDNTNVLKDE